MTKKISIHICTKDRATELGLLLQSLRTQTFQDFNILILDESVNSQVMQFYFIQYLIQRLKLEGHDVKLIKNNIPVGVSMARQQLVDYYMESCSEPLSCRLDDDVIIQPDYLEKLLEVITAGYDIASGVTTPFIGPDIRRSTKFVKPIIDESFLDENGKLSLCMDDCGFSYIEEEIIPCHHFRSCALIKREVLEKIDYKSRLSKNGFREENILSWKALINGFKIGVHTGADAKHLMTPSGGEKQTMNLVPFNQKIFEETTKRMFEDSGDFIQDYNIKIGVGKRDLDMNKFNKSINLINRDAGL